MCNKNLFLLLSGRPSFRFIFASTNSYVSFFGFPLTINATTAVAIIFFLCYSIFILFCFVFLHFFGVNKKKMVGFHTNILAFCLERKQMLSHMECVFSLLPIFFNWKKKRNEINILFSCISPVWGLEKNMSITIQTIPLLCLISVQIFFLFSTTDSILLFFDRCTFIFCVRRKKKNLVECLDKNPPVFYYFAPDWETFIFFFKHDYHGNATAVSKVYFR